MDCVITCETYLTYVHETMHTLFIFFSSTYFHNTHSHHTVDK